MSWMTVLFRARSLFKNSFIAFYAFYFIPFMEYVYLLIKINNQIHFFELTYLVVK